MRRVCCFCESWKSGGIEAFLCNILTRIDLSQIQVDIVTAHLGESVFTKQLQELGVQFYELSGNLRRVPENHQSFRLLLEERQYDIVYVNAYQSLSLYYLYMAKKAAVPVRIAHAHNTSLRKSLTRPLKLLIHRWARDQYTCYATALWACSKNAAEFLFSERELEQRGFTFIPNGIDTARFRFDPAVRESVRKELGLNGKFVIGNVGRLCYQKNQQFLIDVFTELLKQRPESCLLLIGEGDDESMLRQKARELAVTDRVLFCGVSEQVEQLMWAMDVFAFPSRFEGLGIAAIEAQATGLPVLASESVPKEAYVSPLYHSRPLGSGAEAWADALLQLDGNTAERQEAVFAVRDAAFDIMETAEKLGSFFREGAFCE